MVDFVPLLLVCGAVVAVLFSPFIFYVLYYCYNVLLMACRLLSCIMSALFDVTASSQERSGPDSLSNPFNVIMWLMNLILFLPRYTIKIIWTVLLAPFNQPTTISKGDFNHSTTTIEKSIKSPQVRPQVQSIPKQDVNCMECARSMPLNSHIQCSSCKYLSCDGCFQTNATESINNGLILVVCIRCHHKIDLVVLQKHLSTDLLTQLKKTQELDAKIHCRECGGRLHQTNSFFKKKMTCTKCTRAWCSDCNFLYHALSTCKQAKLD